MRFKKFSILCIGVLFFSAATAESSVYRVLDGPRPTKKELEIEELRYGLKLLFTEDPAIEKEPGPKLISEKVFHASLRQMKFFWGKENPLAEDIEILFEIEHNKTREIRELKKAMAHAMPKTFILSDFLDKKDLSITEPHENFLQYLNKILRKEFPRGFFLKPISGFGSDGKFPNAKTDFAKLYIKYLLSVKPEIEKMRENHESEDDIHLALRSTPSYVGFILERLLSNPSLVFVQEKIDANLLPQFSPTGEIYYMPEEYRVHVVSGKVLVGGTQDRWNNWRFRSQERVSEVEAFTQELLAALPERFQKQSYAMDIMRTRDGRWMIIELNPGGDSGYYYPEIDLWVPQVLAEYLSGEPTFLQVELAKALGKNNLRAKVEELNRLLNHKAYVDFRHNVEVMSEILNQAKEKFLEDFLREPSTKNSQTLRDAIKTFHLEPFFTGEELKVLRKYFSDSFFISDLKMSQNEVDYFLNSGCHNALGDLEL